MFHNTEVCTVYHQHQPLLRENLEDPDSLVDPVNKDSVLFKMINDYSGNDDDEH